MNITEAMTQATFEVMAIPGINIVSQINDNNCFTWALKVFNMMPGSAIGGHRIDDEGQSYIIYGGLCYDAETPDGEKNWWDLKSFQRMFRGE